MKKVNLGCGATIAPGWINIDNSWNILLQKIPLLKSLLFKIGLIQKITLEAGWRGKSIKKHDITKGIPFEDESVDFIYCSHVLEHLPISKTRTVLKETYRVLKKDGILRIVVPDLKLLAKNYVEGNTEFFGEEKRPIADQFLESLHIEGFSERPFIERLLHSRHKYMFDADSLRFLIGKAGFLNIEMCKFKQGRCVDLNIIENRDRSVYIEAWK